jgi:predicted molibdopterin-dependent oxidoreductase YjgC
VLDRAFIAEHTDGLRGCCARLAARTPWERSSEPRLARAEMREAGRSTPRAERTIACWAMGITQHRTASATSGDREPAAAARQHRPARRRPCPVRGHSNVQGDRTMGI